MLSDAQRELKPYRGALSPRQIARCMLAAMSNAKEWLEDAIALMARGSYRHTCVACTFAIEEASKVTMLSRCCPMDHNAGKWWKRFWQRYRTHVSKHGSTLISDMLTGQHDGICDEEWVKERGRRIWVTHNLRLFACYSEVVEGEPFCPPDLTDPSFAWGCLLEATAAVTVMEVPIAGLDEDLLTAINERMSAPKARSDEELLRALEAELDDEPEVDPKLPSPRLRNATGALLKQRAQELWVQLPPEVQHEVKETLAEWKDLQKDNGD